MAVQVFYRSSYDPEREFMDRNEADAHDRMLELAEQVAAVITKAVPSITPDQADELSIYMARNREVFAKAFGKKPEALTDLLNPPAGEDAKLKLVDSDAA